MRRKSDVKIKMSRWINEWSKLDGADYGKELKELKYKEIMCCLKRKYNVTTKNFRVQTVLFWNTRENNIIQVYAYITYQLSEYLKWLNN